MVAATTFLSCKNEVNDPVSKEIEFKNEKELLLILPEKYEEIGINHNDMLNDFYFNNANRQILNAKVSYKDFSIEEYFGRIDKKYYFKDMIYDFSRNASNDVSVTETLVRNELLTEEGAEYISKIESILDEPLNSLEETKNAISEIEIEVLDNPENESLYDFFSYAETAKASLDFWNENIEILENNEELNNVDRGIISDIWNKYKHRLGMMAASDAAGAAVGALIGAGFGTQILGAPYGTEIGAVIGATVVGAASSAEGFKTDAICIVVSLDSIRKKIEKKGVKH